MQLSDKILFGNKTKAFSKIPLTSSQEERIRGEALKNNF